MSAELPRLENWLWDGETSSLSGKIFGHPSLKDDTPCSFRVSFIDWPALKFQVLESYWISLGKSLSEIYYEAQEEWPW